MTDLNISEIHTDINDILQNIIDTITLARETLQQLYDDDGAVMDEEAKATVKVVINELEKLV